MEGGDTIIDRIDHLVLHVRDVDASCRFYEKVLGMQLVTFDGNRKALRFGRQRIHLQQSGAPSSLDPVHPTPGAADFCLITDRTREEVLAHLQACNVAPVAGPVAKNGALGPMESIYFRDPDGNLVEIARYDHTPLEH